MNAAFILLMLLTVCQTAFSQVIAERQIIAFQTDSNFKSASSWRFDKEGNYCAEIEQNGLQYFMTNGQMTGGVRFIGSMFGNGGGISYTKGYSDESGNKPWYYRNTNSIRVFGPVFGKLEKHITSNTRMNIAITTSVNDTISYYVNGVLVSRKLKADLSNFDLNLDDWCAFSENGNSIYYIKRDSLYVIFVNGWPLDSSRNSFTALHINNKGNYVYARGHKPPKQINGYTYMFFIHTPDTILGPVRTVWKNELKENNAYYYSGDDNGPEYMLVNNILLKGIKEVSDVILPDRDHYFYSFLKGDQSKLNVNGKIHDQEISEILLPAFDHNGDFAFYGIKDYYLYKFVNGKKIPDPITNYGVRPVPLYISPKGESLHYFLTDDSIYLYRDKQLVFEPITKQKKIVVETYENAMGTYSDRNKAANGNHLFYMEYGGDGYWVFNGLFSRPMLPVKSASYSEGQKTGEIVASQMNEHGFFSVQKTDDSRFLININNRFYKELNGVERILKDSYFFDEKELVVYGVKGLSIYQYKITW